jgi:sugar fermentation stimulation protein A
VKNTSNKFANTQLPRSPFKAFVPFGADPISGRFIARRKRFLADILLDDGRQVVAHCANTGSMRGNLEPDAPVVLIKSDNPKRKLKYTWKAIMIGRTWIGIDTSVPNRLAEAAIAGSEVPGLDGYDEVLREKKMGEHSRVDLLLKRKNELCYVEVKNVTLVERGVARFPDAVTARGLKHLHELAAQVKAGNRAAMFYLIQRADGKSFVPAADIDPVYAKTLADVQQKGVEIFVFSAAVNPRGVRLKQQIPYQLT